MTSIMKNPPHPGGLVRDNIEALGLSIAEAARAFGVTRQQLYRLVGGQSGISAEMAVRLEQAVGGSADAWLRMQAAYDVAQIRKAGRVKLRRLPGVESSSASATEHF